MQKAKVRIVPGRTFLCRTSGSNLENPYLQWCEGDSLEILRIIFKLTLGSSQIIKQTSHITTK